VTKFRSYVSRFFTSRGSAAFVFAALAVGVFAGLAAAVLIKSLIWVQEVPDYLSENLSFGRWAPLVVIPPGIFFAWLLARHYGRHIESGGVTETMVGVSLRAGYLSTRTIGPKLLATAATLGLGGSGGREGPIVLIGASIGSSLARYTHFGEDQIRSLVAAGAGAGIGASFNAPIAGMLFALEVILGNFAIRHLNAVVVASVAAAVTTHSIVGQERFLSASPHSLKDPRELLLYVLLGLVATVASVLFLRTLNYVEKGMHRRPYPDWLRPLLGGLGVAILGVIDHRVLGTGQEFLTNLVSAGADSSFVWEVLLMLGLLKMLTSSLTRSGGGSGGTLMPSLFIGGALGAAMAQVIAPAWGFSELSTGAFALVGMAATFAAVARAPLTAIIIVFEISGNYNLVLPLMLATALGTLLAERLFSESSYTLPLARKGIHLLATEDIDLLDTVTVEEVMSRPHEVIDPGLTTTMAAEVLDRERHHGMPVVKDGRLLGVVTLSDLAEAEEAGEGARLVTSAMVEDPITVTPEMPVSSALARMAALGVGRLPVVAEDDPGRYLGMFRRESVVRAYHHALGGTADRQLYRERLKQRLVPGTTFYELPVRRGSTAAGKLVKQLEWPEGATLVSVRRGASVLIPHGDTVIRVGDTITAFGTGDSRVALAYLLEHQPETPPASEAGDRRR
jgi:CIC family chloride channel protein